MSGSCSSNIFSGCLWKCKENFHSNNRNQCWLVESHCVYSNDAIQSIIRLQHIFMHAMKPIEKIQLLDITTYILGTKSIALKLMDSMYDFALKCDFIINKYSNFVFMKMYAHELPNNYAVSICDGSIVLK